MKKTPIFTAMTLVLMALVAFMACSSSTPSAEDGNGIYYWRTTMSLSDAERDFLDRHKVGKMYVRFFDVGLPGSLATGESVVPNATIAPDVLSKRLSGMHRPLGIGSGQAPQRYRDRHGCQLCRGCLSA